MTASNRTSKRILVVDDEKDIRNLIARRLKNDGYEVVEADNGKDGLFQIQKKIPDLVLTDIHMPVMDGFLLLTEINRLMLPLPTIVITGLSNEEDVIMSLRLGVRDFIRKPFNTDEMMKIIEKVLTSPKGKSNIDELIPFIEEDYKKINLPNDVSILNMASYYLTRDLPERGLCTFIEKENIRHALEEALSNAMLHGNLEMSSELKSIGSVADNAFNVILEQRKVSAPYCNRTIQVNYQITKEKIEYIIEDEGPGFDYMNLPDPLHPDNFFKPYGRGLFFIRLHVDDVKWNERGNIVTLTKFKSS
jgi:CheY-like chemotaxis protein/anti-sigma regulatory factor (Ser/Thr protein kinase)